jgi:hypothetical protein
VNNAVAVGDRGGYVHFMSTEKGLLLNRLHLSGKFYQDPISMGKEVLVSTHSGKIAAIHFDSKDKAGSV